MRTRLHPAADAELMAAAQWYEDRSAGLGERFIKECVDAFIAIEKHPRRYSKVRSRTSREIRRCQLIHFPYSVIYEVGARQCAIVAVAHAKRRPNYWRDRLT